MEDWLLIILCKQGNTKALGRLYGKYKRDCLLIAMTLVNDMSAAEDIWHDVFVRFAQTLADFRLKGPFKPYLMTCVANHAKNYVKSKQRALKPESMHWANQDAPEPLDGLVLNEQTQYLAEALAQLPVNQRANEKVSVPY